MTSLELLVAGVDEAGRGPLAGPVVASACVLRENLSFEGLRDSKQLSAKQRQILYQRLISTDGVYFGIGISDEKTIEEINILQATMLAMQQAVKALPFQPRRVIVDGNYLPKGGFLTSLGERIEAKSVIRGDQIEPSIMAASILAKETRDRIMEEYHCKWPVYRFDLHKGYGTKVHLEALRQYGPSPIHRKGFRGVR